jgi:aspartyl-tRNA(Asn)/glutamyl-tRNA(Gln) amidotransferase subunit A
MKTLSALAADLAAGKTTSEKLTRECLEKIAEPSGEGQRAFIKVYAGSAIACARASDLQRAHGVLASPLAGIPISIKDLFDVAGDVTRAGSIILRDAPAATHDAPAIARLRAAGAVIVGRTNMTEFAYGAHGMNHHYGTPLNPYDRATHRIPGGSTSGGAVSVTDGMAAATIGSDTGGSVRIPSALCGITGFKPTQARVPLVGAFPLSTTRDSIGPLGNSVACCVWLDAIMAGEEVAVPVSFSLKGLRFGVPTTRLLDDLTPQVASAFERVLLTLSAHGALIEEFAFPEIEQEVSGSAKANFSAVEAYALHRERLAQHPDKFDPRVYKRLLLGANMNAADYYDLILLREKLIASANETTARFDALLTPTSPIIAPSIAEMNSNDEVFFRNNTLLLRNCAPFNVLDRPCWSLPIHRAGDAPVGLMVVGERMQDRRLHQVALGIESALNALRIN